jgi:hypothetical protein
LIEACRSFRHGSIPEPDLGGERRRHPADVLRLIGTAGFGIMLTSLASRSAVALEVALARISAGTPMGTAG